MAAKFVGTFVLKSKDELLASGWEIFRYGKSLRHRQRNDYIHRTSYHMLGEKVDVYWVDGKYVSGYDIMPHGVPYKSDSTQAIYYLSDYRNVVK